MNKNALIVSMILLGGVAGGFSAKLSDVRENLNQHDANTVAELCFKSDKYETSFKDSVNFEITSQKWSTGILHTVTKHKKDKSVCYEIKTFFKNDNGIINDWLCDLGLCKPEVTYAYQGISKNERYPLVFAIVGNLTFSPYSGAVVTIPDLAFTFSYGLFNDKWFMTCRSCKYATVETPGWALKDTVTNYTIWRPANWGTKVILHVDYL